MIAITIRKTWFREGRIAASDRLTCRPTESCFLNSGTDLTSCCLDPIMEKKQHQKPKTTPKFCLQGRCLQATNSENNKKTATIFAYFVVSLERFLCFTRLEQQTILVYPNKGNNHQTKPYLPKPYWCFVDKQTLFTQRSRKISGWPCIAGLWDLQTTKGLKYP